MRIVHYLRRVRLEDGGVPRAVLDMCALPARHGHDVTLLTSDATDAPAEWKTGGEGLPTVVELPAPAWPGGLFSGSQRRQIGEVIRSADALHLHAAWTPSNVQLGRLARRLRVPYVLTPHGMLDDWCMEQKTPKKRVFLALGGRATLEGAAFVHCTAQAELDQSGKWFPRGRGIVVPLIFDLTPFRELRGAGEARAAYPALSSGEPVLLFLSRVHPKKGVEKLIDAAALLRDSGRPVRVLIAGPGDDSYVRELKQRIGSLGLDDRVELIGMVTGTKKVSLYEASDVFVLPTSQENFGIVLPEAMACRTPVVTTRGVDIWAELEGSGGAVIVEPPTGEALAGALEPLIDDAGLRARMGDAGRGWVLTQLDPDRIAREFESMYERARGGAR